MEQQIEIMPGRRSGGLALFSPMDGNQWGFAVFFPEKPVAGCKNAPTSAMNRVTPNFLAAIGQPVLRGRGFTPDDDTANSPLVAVVNQAFAKKFLPGKAPISRRFGS